MDPFSFKWIRSYVFLLTNMLSIEGSGPQMAQFSFCGLIYPYDDFLFFVLEKSAHTCTATLKTSFGNCFSSLWKHLVLILQHCCVPHVCTDDIRKLSGIRGLRTSLPSMLSLTVLRFHFLTQQLCHALTFPRDNCSRLRNGITVPNHDITEAASAPPAVGAKMSRSHGHHTENKVSCTIWNPDSGCNIKIKI